MNQQSVLAKAFSFPLTLHQFFNIEQKQEYEWKLIQAFSLQIIERSIYDEFNRHFYLSLNPNQAVQFVFKDMNKINELLALVIKIRKDIIYTQYKEANTNDNSSMFSTYQNLQNYMTKTFDVHMQEHLKKYQLTNYGIFDLLVFNHLYKSRSFHRVITKGVAPQISTLFSWYQEFVNNFEIEGLMDAYYLPKKEKRHQLQIIEQQKSNPEFIESIKDDKYEKFKEIIESGVSPYTISTRDKEKMMAPHLVAGYARIKYAQLLSDYQIDWECEDGDKMTPLFYAIRSESIEMMEYLINKKVNLEHNDIQNRTPFYYACSLGQLHVIKYLKQRGANINSKTSLGRTPFSKSSFLGLYNVITFLLEQPEIDYNYADKQGRNALHNAVFGPKGGRDGRKVGTWCHDSPQIAQLLLEFGMDVESLDKDQNTPLHVAASSEALQSIPILIAFGCDINKRNKWGETALMIAAKFNHLETVKLLLDRGADINLLNEGYTAMEIAAKNYQFETYSFLLEQMKPQLLQLQKLNKSKLQSILQSIMLLTKTMENNSFINYFLDNFQPIYEEDLINLIIDMNDCQEQLMKSYLQNTQITEQLIQQQFEVGLKKKKLIIFKQICSNANNKNYQIVLNKTLITLLLENQELNNLLFNYNIDWFNYRSKLGETFLHRVVEKRKTTILVKILNYFQEIIDQKQQEQIYQYNQSLKDINKDKIYSYLIQQDEKSTQIIELSVIHKFMDIYQMLEHFFSVNFGSKQGLKFTIPDYSIELDHTTKLPQITLQKEPQLESISQLNQIFNQTQNEQDFFQRVLLEKNKGKQQLSQFYQYIQQNKKVQLIENEEQLIVMIETIMQNYKIFGIDVEHYSDKVEDYKLSFTCTIQISTIDNDYVIDIMKLRSVCTKHLSKLFSSDKHLKIFHGCDVDLRVLFSDLRIQVIYLLDTSRIDMILIKSPNAQSLEKLCKQYINIHLEKLYQTSDWRIRPLPLQMIEYARLDSSCLLFLFAILMEDCKNNKLITKVYFQCQKLSLTTQYPLINIKDRN